MDKSRAFIEGADETLLESIIGAGEDYIDSGGGGGDFNLSNLFGGGDEFQGSPRRYKQIEDYNDLSYVPNLIQQTQEGIDTFSWKNGGQVPKYKNGGEVDMGDLISALAAKGITYKGRSNQLEHTDWGGYEASGKYEVDTPECTRFYEGKDSSKDMQVSMDKALINALSTALGSPSDSLVAQAPKKYYGGGSVSDSPTITDYFATQGKTPGGSDTQSLAEKLGSK